jgi:hypothetical protein
MTTERSERARARAHRRYLRSTPEHLRIRYPWSDWRYALEEGPPVSSRAASAARRFAQKVALRTALMRHVPRQSEHLGPWPDDFPSSWRGFTGIQYIQPLVASVQPGAKLGPGPRCRFCTKLLVSVEWRLERCIAHYDVDIAQCPATAFDLAHFNSWNSDRL